MRRGRDEVSVDPSGDMALARDLALESRSEETLVQAEANHCSCNRLSTVGATKYSLERPTLGIRDMVGATR